MLVFGSTSDSCLCLFYAYSEDQPEETDIDRQQWRAQISTVLEAIKTEQRLRTEDEALEKMKHNPHFSLADLQDLASAAEARNEFPPPTSSMSSESRLNHYGTATNFDYKALIKTRKEHETEESRSSITHRYQHPTSSSSKSLNPSTNSDDSHKLKGQILHKIIHTISSSLTDAGTSSNTAIASTRLARWRAQGVYPVGEQANSASRKDEDEHDARTLTGVSGTFPPSRNAYAALQNPDLPRVKFSTANVSETYPLRVGSFVIFVYRAKLYLGQGKSRAQHITWYLPYRPFHFYQFVFYT